MNNNRKKYVQIKNHTFSDQILALLDNAQSDEEEDIEELMNDSDTVFSANDKDIDNIVPDSDNANILTPEASIHIVKDNEKEQGKNCKASLKKSNFSGDVTLLLTLEKNAILVGEVCHQLKESASPLEVVASL